MIVGGGWKDFSRRAPFIYLRPGVGSSRLFCLKIDIRRRPATRIVPWETALAALLRSLLSLSLGLR